MISESGSVEAMLRGPGFPPFNNHHPPSIDHTRLDRLDPMQNQLCRVCEEPAAGFHFGAFTCEGCKSFFGRTCNNQSVIQECKNNYRCVVDKKNRTACKACRLRKCLMVGMSKSGSRYGRRSNWFKIHCLMQQNLQNAPNNGKPMSPPMSSSASASSLSPNGPPSMWATPPKAETMRSPDIREAASPVRTPEPPMSLMSHAGSTASTLPFSHAPAVMSPFKSLLPNMSPLGAPLPKPEASHPSVNMSHPMTSLYGGFPSPLSLMSSVPGFPGIPIHKQALLSPLLAQTHLWQMARSNPLLAGLRPEMDLFAEHKALVERYSAAMAAAAAQPKDDKADLTTLLKSPKREPSVSPPHSVTPEPPQNIPMDLSSKKGDDGSSADEDLDEDDEEIEVKETSPSPISDVNKNLVLSRDASSVLNLCSK
eukprot:maker-scaffold80_size398941-snap-gene-2.16 protein:Tk02826 transcript:maker-scaffold80_size398941-snap-gene-2.16-mRNA-1 annotation:"AGAP010438-PA"